MNSGSISFHRFICQYCYIDFQALKHGINANRLTLNFERAYRTRLFKLTFYLHPSDTMPMQLCTIKYIEANLSQLLKQFRAKKCLVQQSYKKYHSSMVSQSVSSFSIPDNILEWGFLERGLIQCLMLKRGAYSRSLKKLLRHSMLINEC